MKTFDMKKMKKCFTILLLSAPICTLAWAVDRGDIRLLSETKITLLQAIESAQKNHGGQAIEASLDDDSFKPVYEVSLVKDERVFDVQVDAVTGEVIGSREDIDD